MSEPAKSIDGKPGGLFRPRRVVMTADADCKKCEGTGRVKGAIYPTPWGPSTESHPLYSAPLCECVKAGPA